MNVPTPRNGWRVLAGEVGVIVLGVLIALGAQQAVQEIQIRGEVKTFRETIDREIALSLWTYDARSSEVDCTNARIAQLNRLLDDYREGSIVALIDATYPRTFSSYRSAWDNRDGNVFAHLPAAARTKYAEFYDELANNEVVRIRERDAWTTLLPFEQAGPLSIDDRRKLHSTARMIARFNEVQQGNLQGSRMIAKALGIIPSKPDTISPEDILDTKTCGTLAETAGQGMRK